VERVMPEQVADFEGRSAVEDEHLVAALEERVGKVRAEETSASGDQNLHKVSWSFGGFVRTTHRHDAARRTDSAPVLAGDPAATSAGGTQVVGGARVCHDESARAGGGLSTGRESTAMTTATDSGS